MRYHLFHQFSFMSGFPPFPLAFFCRLHQRNDERKLKANSNRPVEKIGYVTRNKQAEGMKASGFSSAAMMGKQDPDQVKKKRNANTIRYLSSLSTFSLPYAM